MSERAQISRKTSAVERMDDALSGFLTEAVPSGWSSQARHVFDEAREELSEAWLALQQEVERGGVS